jgi:chitin synthase
MDITIQKYLLILILLLLNVLLITTFVVYENNWYAFIYFLAFASFLYSVSVVLIFLCKICSSVEYNDYRIYRKNYIYVVPCYNEGEEELRDSLTSLTYQQICEGDKRLLLIICDGIVKGKGNNSSTDIILKNILGVDSVANYYTYETWDGSKNVIRVYKGRFINKIDYILCIKQENYGKRDSLVLARKWCYNYNFKEINKLEDNLENDMYYNFKEIFYINMDYIIGIDADTVFDYNCSYELIKEIDRDNNIHGCVGYVDISNKMNKLSLFTMYQYGEYTFAQCLRRYAQSYITKKVNCLSGCNQILRVSRETCGDKILAAFNRLPREDENIFNHIRSYASEDRNHVCLMLSMYPYVKTIQNIKAVCYTRVPGSIRVFLSQRRRWNLGANCNDMLLTYLPGINIFERISALVNVTTFSISPFILTATVFFIRAILNGPSKLMLYLSIIMIIPGIYSFLIPIVIKPLTIRGALYYYMCLIMYFCLGLPVNLVTYIYALIHMDVIKWGKTRSIEKDSIKSVEWSETSETIESSESSESSVSLKNESAIKTINVDINVYMEYARETYV